MLCDGGQAFDSIEPQADTIFQVPTRLPPHAADTEQAPPSTPLPPPPPPPLPPEPFLFAPLPQPAIATHATDTTQCRSRFITPPPKRTLIQPLYAPPRSAASADSPHLPSPLAARRSPSRSRSSTGASRTSAES